MAGPFGSESYVIYRVVVKLKGDQAYEKACARLNENDSIGEFEVSWWPQENILEALIIASASELDKSGEKLDGTQRLREFFSLDGMVEGFIECYRLDSAMLLLPAKHQVRELRYGDTDCRTQMLKRGQ